MRVQMTRSFKDPNARIPNFGVEGALPEPRPWWADFDDWRVVPPASSLSSPPPLSPPDGPDPFDVSPPMQAPLRPRSDMEGGSAGSELLDWLFRSHRADRNRNARPLPPAPSIDGPATDFFDRRPSRFVQSDPDLVQSQPFYASQLDALLRLRPEELIRSTRDTPSRGVQPPIFFPFD